MMDIISIKSFTAINITAYSYGLTVINLTICELI